MLVYCTAFENPLIDLQENGYRVLYCTQTHQKTHKHGYTVLCIIMLIGCCKNVYLWLKI